MITNAKSSSKKSFSKKKRKKRKKPEHIDDYDSPWKLIIEQYFEDFLAFFFPKAHQKIDWSKKIEFLSKELQQISKEATVGRQHVDVLVKVWLKSGESLWVLIHVEVQSQKKDDFGERISIYNHRIFDWFRVPVESMAILGDEDENWRPSSYSRKCWECKLNFEFPMVKLLDYRQKLDSLEKSRNPFATVVLSHLKTKETKGKFEERRKEKLNLIKALYRKGYKKQEIINLFHFIDWIMSLPEEQGKLFYEELTKFEEEKKMRYVTSVERIGIEKGEKKGKKEGKKDFLTKQLKHRFGEVPSWATEKLNQADPSNLELWGIKILDAKSLEEVLI